MKDTQKADLKRVAECHIRVFPDSLSSRLGIKYCIKMISFYLDDDRGLLFHLEEGHRIYGYCCGIETRNFGLHGSTTSMTQYTFKSLVINIMIRPWLLFHPQILHNFPLIRKNIALKLCKREGKKRTSPAPPMGNFVPSLGLVAIGVDPLYQGKGYGSLILKEFEKRAGNIGFKRIGLSVRKNNHQAIAAYKKNGWQINKEGTEELSMYKTIDI